MDESSLGIGRVNIQTITQQVHYTTQQIHTHSYTQKPNHTKTLESQIYPLCFSNIFQELLIFQRFFIVSIIKIIHKLIIIGFLFLSVTNLPRSTHFLKISHFFFKNDSNQRLSLCFNKNSSQIYSFHKGSPFFH